MLSEFIKSLKKEAQSVEPAIVHAIVSAFTAKVKTQLGTSTSPVVQAAITEVNATLDAEAAKLAAKA